MRRRFVSDTGVENLTKDGRVLVPFNDFTDTPLSLSWLSAVMTVFGDDDVLFCVGLNIPDIYFLALFNKLCSWSPSLSFLLIFQWSVGSLMSAFWCHVHRTFCYFVLFVVKISTFIISTVSWEFLDVSFWPCTMRIFLKNQFLLYFCSSEINISFSGISFC